MQGEKTGVCVLSWDDGAPDDLRVAEICARYGLDATFFLPITNPNGSLTLSSSQIRLLASGGFEIGSHTKDHSYLDSCDVKTGQDQILSGRGALEEILGAKIDGFCYPGGKVPPGYPRFLQINGFAYGRTVENFWQMIPNRLYEMPVTLQLYPHSRSVLIKNSFAREARTNKLQLALLLCSRNTLSDRLSLLVDKTVAEAGILHIWGHSWELETFGGWAILDDLCKRLAASGLKSLTVRAAAEAAGYPRL